MYAWVLRYCEGFVVLPNIQYGAKVRRIINLADENDRTARSVNTAPTETKGAATPIVSSRPDLLFLYRPAAKFMYLLLEPSNTSAGENNTTRWRDGGQMAGGAAVSAPRQEQPQCTSQASKLAYIEMYTQR